MGIKCGSSRGPTRVVSTGENYIDQKGERESRVLPFSEVLDVAKSHKKVQCCPGSLGTLLSIEHDLPAD